MVGEGDQKKTAIELINRLDLNHKITLEPFRQDVPAILAAADLYVLPSLWEGLPIGLLEAMSMGKAVIVSDVDGTSEIVQNYENGLLISTDELIDNLAAALMSICSDENLRKSLSEKAKTTIEERFDALTMTKDIENKYLDVLKKYKDGI